LQNDLYSTYWHFLTDSIIAISIQKHSMAIFFSTYSANLIKIGPVTPEITNAKSTPFLTKWQKSAFHTNYLSMYEIDRNHTFYAGRQMYADYKTEINFAIIKGTLLW